MAISSFSNYSIEAVRSAAAEVGYVDHAIQLYTMRDREMQEGIIKTAEKAGCKAIFLTADSPVLGVRYNEWRNDFRTPEGLEFPVVGMTTEKIRAQTHDSGFVAFNDDSHSWTRDIPWLRQRTDMQIWIKGVLTAEDTELAVRHGCDGIIVTNHGGRQLDGVMATLDALPECVDAAKGRIAVHVDGGFRSGTDIFKALALGADCCWVGRPAIWGLAVCALALGSVSAMVCKVANRLTCLLLLSTMEKRGWILCLRLCITNFDGVCSSQAARMLKKLAKPAWLESMLMGSSRDCNAGLV